MDISPPIDPCSAWKAFIELGNPQSIADLLQQDKEECSQGGRPSLVALFLPDSTTDRAAEIASFLRTSDTTDATNIPLSVLLFWYQGIVDNIKSQLGRVSVVEHFTQKVPDSKVPTTPVRAEPTHLNRTCYMCRLFLSQEPGSRSKHPAYSSCCWLCGEFNLANSEISMPWNLDLHSKTAVVTGGRVNLGYATALRLLRCGARVIVSSRYPGDAEARYQAEKDAQSWASRLTIIGADFRNARDAFNLVAQTKQRLVEWNANGKLDILVNNAAQTLTDTIPAERAAIQRESLLDAKRSYTIESRSYTPGDSGKRLSLISPGSKYMPRIRGGANTSWVTAAIEHNGDSTPDVAEISYEKGGRLALSGLDSEKSSWLQTLSEIPYEDIMSAQSVNFFVPLILYRELLSNLCAAAKEVGFDGKPETAHVINVSSREGLFESLPTHSAKNGQHVHTNASKAALNMITETEASTAWTRYKICVNTIDPGFMSAAPEIKQKIGSCPLTFEDGAARVLWPVAKVWGGSAEREVIWGRFLKHFGMSEVNASR